MRAIVFDFDNCLCAADEVGQELYAPGFNAIRAANRGHLSEPQLAAAFEACWRQPLDHVAHTHGFSPAMLEAGWKFFSEVEVSQPLQGYADLAVLREFRCPLFLVTSGFHRLQWSKVRALNIEHRFTAVEVDAIDRPNRVGKQGIFERFARQHDLPHAEVLVVGDSPASEIAAGNRLGMPTVQILRPGVTRCDTAGHHVHGLAELHPLVGTER